jgi:hypothetical protein
MRTTDECGLADNELRTLSNCGSTTMRIDDLDIVFAPIVASDFVRRRVRAVLFAARGRLPRSGIESWCPSEAHIQDLERSVRAVVDLDGARSPSSYGLYYRQYYARLVNGRRMVFAIYMSSISEEVLLQFGSVPFAHTGNDRSNFHVIYDADRGCLELVTIGSGVIPGGCSASVR